MTRRIHESQTQYEAPRLTVLGEVETLTLQKRAGSTDGLHFHGHPITNHS